MTEPSDVISFDADKRRGVGSLPARIHKRAGGSPPMAPCLWDSPETLLGEAAPGLKGDAVYGQYPKRFIPWAAKLLRAAPDRILHMCSGSLPPGQGFLRVDLRRAAAPDIVADARKLPFADGVFDAVMIDPPYSVEYADGLYGVEYPRPSHLLAEASRVVKPCGRIGFLHFIVPSPPPGCRIDAIRGVTTGCGFRIRAFTVFEREQDGLFDADAPPPTRAEETR